MSEGDKKEKEETKHVKVEPELEKEEIHQNDFLAQLTQKVNDLEIAWAESKREIREKKARIEELELLLVSGVSEEGGDGIQQRAAAFHAQGLTPWCFFCNSPNATLGVPPKPGPRRCMTCNSARLWCEKRERTQQHYSSLTCPRNDNCTGVYQHGKRQTCLKCRIKKMILTDFITHLYINKAGNIVMLYPFGAEPSWDTDETQGADGGSDLASAQVKKEEPETSNAEQEDEIVSGVNKINLGDARASNCQLGK